MPAWQKLIWITTCLLVSWAFEGNFPLVDFNYKKWRHAGVNIVFLSFTMVINILFGIITVGIFAYISKNELGLLHLVNFPIWVELISDT